MNKKEEKKLKVETTKLFFKYLEKASNDDYKPFPITYSETNIDEDYGIYNSFKINELPDYLFGIWWSLETHIERNYVYEGEGIENRKIVTEKVDYLIGSFFGDYEREVDKFKPWRCYFNVGLCVPVKQIKKLIAGEIDYFPWDDTYATYGSIRDILDKFIFIKTEPELAFCQCWCGLNYNETHVTRAYARKEYKKYLKYKTQKQDEENDALKVQFNYIKQLLDSYGFEQFKDYFVFDRDYGSEFMTSHRYEIIFKVQKSWKDFLDKPNKYGYYGTYFLGDILGNNDVESNKLYKQYQKFIASTKRHYKYIWFLDDIDFFGVIATSKTFSSHMNEESVVDITQPEKYFANEIFE